MSKMSHNQMAMFAEETAESERQSAEEDHDASIQSISEEEWMFEDDEWCIEVGEEPNQEAPRVVNRKVSTRHNNFRIVPDFEPPQ